MSFPVGRISRVAASLGPWALAFLLSLGPAAGAARAQGASSIGGVVTDPTGAAIPTAAVTVKSLETGAVRSVLSGQDGRYEAPLLAVGSYEVSAEKAGFQPARAAITLVIGESATVNLTLSVAQVNEDVQVEESAVGVSVTNTDVSGLVGERQVKDLPLNGRSYDQLLDAESRRGQLHLAARGRDRHLQFRGRQHVFRFRPAAAGESLPAERRGVHQRVGNQQHARRSERAASGRGCGARILRGEGYLRRRIRQASRRSGQHRHRLRHRTSFTATSTNSCATARLTRETSSIDPRSRSSNATCSAASLGGPIKKDKTFLFGNYEGLPPEPGPERRHARAGRSPQLRRAVFRPAPRS